MKLKVKKGSKVKVITGSEKGKSGVVLVVDRDAMRVKIEGVKMMTKHTKKDGLVKTEGFIHYSNVKLLEEAAPKKGSLKKAAKQA